MNGNKILIIHSFLFLKLISHSSEAYFQNLLVFRYFHTFTFTFHHTFSSAHMGWSQFAVKLFVCPQTICRPSSNKVETPGGTKYQIQIPNTEYQIHAPKHQTHARPKTFFCCRFIGALQTSKGKGHLDDRLGRKKIKLNTTHFWWDQDHLFMSCLLASCHHHHN